MSSILYYSVPQLSTAAVSAGALQASGVFGHELQPDIAGVILYLVFGFTNLLAPVTSQEACSVQMLHLWSVLAPAVLAEPHGCLKVKPVGQI